MAITPLMPVYARCEVRPVRGEAGGGRLVNVGAVSVRNGLALLGVSAPEKM